MLTDLKYVPDIDPGIKHEVSILNQAGIETFESCEGGDGHEFLIPTIRFYGEKNEGYRAVAVAMQNGLKVTELRRVWSIIDSELSGPFWEMTFDLS